MQVSNQLNTQLQPLYIYNFFIVTQSPLTKQVISLYAYSQSTPIHNHTFNPSFLSQKYFKNSTQQNQNFNLVCDAMNDLDKNQRAILQTDEKSILCYARRLQQPIGVFAFIQHGYPEEMANKFLQGVIQIYVNKVGDNWKRVWKDSIKDDNFDDIDGQLMNEQDIQAIKKWFKQYRCINVKKRIRFVLNSKSLNNEQKIISKGDQKSIRNEETVIQKVVKKQNGMGRNKQNNKKLEKDNLSKVKQQVKQCILI